MIRATIVTMLLLLTVGCASHRTTVDSNPPFSQHHYTHHDLDVTWQSQKTANGVLVSGQVTNMKSTPMRDLDLTLRTLDANRSVIGKGYAEFPNLLPPKATAPFRVEITPAPGSEVNKIRFTYYYSYAEDLSGGSETPHFGGFESAP